MKQEETSPVKSEKVKVKQAFANLSPGIQSQISKAADLNKKPDEVQSQDQEEAEIIHAKSKPKVESDDEYYEDDQEVDIKQDQDQDLKKDQGNDEIKEFEIDEDQDEDDYS